MIRDALRGVGRPRSSLEADIWGSGISTHRHTSEASSFPPLPRALFATPEGLAHLLG
jgi:hypothetical protein